MSLNYQQQIYENAAQVQALIESDERGLVPASQLRRITRASIRLNYEAKVVGIRLHIPRILLSAATEIREWENATNPPEFPNFDNITVNDERIVKSPWYHKEHRCTTPPFLNYPFPSPTMPAKIIQVTAKRKRTHSPDHSGESRPPPFRRVFQPQTSENLTEMLNGFEQVLGLVIKRLGEVRRELGLNTPTIPQEPSVEPVTMQ